MDVAFWTQRWSEGRIAFHEGKANAYLAQHARVLAGRTVLVPLCGKAEDLAFLAAQGHDVVGIEVVEDAVKAFFAEHELTPAVREEGGVRVYSAASVTIVAGDFFATTRELVGPVDGYYDRAALIALPPEMRPRYAAHVRALLAKGSKGLLVALEHANPTTPPFSVGEDEIRALYGDANVHLLGEGPAQERFVDGRERCFSIDF
ncbi:MAG: hypothetical protein KIT84_44380 [Labilithrix sp.]|nr:hypothetical protein [Labilithrix sp.]MCW5818117.1 hypothetical protein [Labilithrix sp.]